jgi:hypothetical protein
MRSLVILAMILFACGEAGEMRATGQPDWSQSLQLRLEKLESQPVATPTERVYADPDVTEMRFAVDEWLIPYFNAVAARYKNKLDITLSISDDGIPLWFTDLPEGLGGQAHYGVACHGFQCNDPEYGAHIWIDEPYARRVVDNGAGLALESTIGHEIGHVLSGWGACAAGLEVTESRDHLKDDGHMMSPMADANMFWDSSDSKLLCSCGDCEAK